MWGMLNSRPLSSSKWNFLRNRCVNKNRVLGQDPCFGYATGITHVQKDVGKAKTLGSRIFQPLEVGKCADADMKIEKEYLVNQEEN